MYKYYAPKGFNLEALEDECFWCSKRYKLNDEYDTYGEIILKYSKLVEALESKGLNTKDYAKILDSFGICSFTSTVINDYFWKEYSINYSGWALEFDDSKFDDDFMNKNNGLLLQNVYYQDDWPDLDNFDTYIPLENNLSTPIRGLLQNEKNAEKLFLFLLLLKNKKKWGIEDETRILIGKNHEFISEDRLDSGVDENGEKRLGYKLDWPPKVLKRIILGSNISEENQKKLIEISKKKNVPIFNIAIMDNFIELNILII